MIALCSRCYYIDEQESEQTKYRTKGMSKRRNNITWQPVKAALNGSTDRAENRGIRMINGWMVTYEQQKLGLSAYYYKRWVLPDEIHTEPIECHILFRLTGGRTVLGGTTNNSLRTRPRFGPSCK